MASPLLPCPAAPGSAPGAPSVSVSSSGSVTRVGVGDAPVELRVAECLRRQQVAAVAALHDVLERERDIARLRDEAAQHVGDAGSPAPRW